MKSNYQQVSRLIKACFTLCLILAMGTARAQFTETDVIPSDSIGLCTAGDSTILSDVRVMEISNGAWTGGNGDFYTYVIGSANGLFKFDTNATVTWTESGNDLGRLIEVTTDIYEDSIVVEMQSTAGHGGHQIGFTLSGIAVIAKTAGEDSLVRTAGDWSMDENNVVDGRNHGKITVVNPNVTADAGINQTLCAATNTTLAAVDVNPDNGQWIQLSGTVATFTNTDPASSITGLVAGDTVVMEWVTYTDSSCADRDTVSIFNLLTPTAPNAGTDSSLCNSTSITLYGNNPTIGTGTWRGSTSNVGGATFVDANLFNTVVNGLIPGNSYDFIWTIDNGTCSGASVEDTVTITTDPLPTSANAGTDIDVCASATATLAATSVSSPSTGTWITALDGGTFDTPASAGSGVSGLTAGNSYRFVWETSTNAHCADTDTVLVTVYENPTTAAAGTDSSDCDITSIDLYANTPSVGTGAWTRITGPFATIVTASSPSSTVNLSNQDAAYTFRWTVSNGNCPVSTDDVVITSDATPTTAAAGTDQSTCNTTATLSGNNPAVGTGMWTTTAATTASVDNAPLSNSGVSSLTAGSNEFIWTITNGVCPSSADTVDIVRGTTPSQPSAVTGDMIVCINDSNLTYSVETDPNVTQYHWTINQDGSFDLNGLQTLTTTDTFATVDFGTFVGAYNFSITPENGCGTGSPRNFAVTNNSLPIANPISGTTTPACAAIDQNYFVFNTGNTFQWVLPSDVTNVTGATTNTVEFDFATATDSVITLIETNASGCQTTNTLSYSLVGCSLDADFTANTLTPCLGNIVRFDASSTVGSPTDYSWDFGADQVIIDAAPDSSWVDVYFTSTGAKTIELTATEGVTNTETKNNYITVGVAPRTATITGNATPSCNASGEVYSVTNTPGSTYNWSVSAADAVIASGGTSNSITVNFGEQNGIVKVVEEDANGCNALAYYSGYLSFDGVNDYATISPGTGAEIIDNVSGAVALWFRIPNGYDYTDDGILWYTADITNEDGNPDDGSGIELSLAVTSEERIRLFVDGDATEGGFNMTLQSAASYNDGDWHHVVAGWDADHDKDPVNAGVLYIDGALVASQASYDNGTTEVDGWVVSYLGRPGANSNYFAGDLDEVIMWDDILTSQEVQAIFASGSTPEGSGLSTGFVGHYPFEEGTGSVIADSAKGNDGSLAGGSATPSRGALGSDVSQIDKVQTMPITLIGCGIAANFNITGGSLNDTTICSGDSLTFTDVSSTTSTPTYEWDFNLNDVAGVTITPSETSTAQGPHNVTFETSTSQTLTVRLIITEGSVKDTLDRTIFVNGLPVVAEVDTTQILCNGDATGGARVTVSTSPNGGESFNWTNAAYSSIGEPDRDSLVNVTAGQYHVIVTDNKGCADTASFLITEPAAPFTLSSMTTTATSVNGATDGTARVTPSGGVRPYSYVWSPTPLSDPAVNDSIGLGFPGGVVNVAATDANGCVANQSGTVSEPNAISPGSIGLGGTSFFADVCENDNVPQYSNVTPASDGAGGVMRYYFQYSTDGANWIDYPVVDSSNAFYDFNMPITENTFVRRRAHVQGGLDTVQTSAVILFYHELPNVELFGFQYEEHCADETSVLLEGSPKGATSMYTSGTAVFTTNADGSINFDAQASGAGTHFLNYTYTDGEGCVNSVMDSVVVYDLPNVSYTGLDPIYSITSNPVPLSGLPRGGTFAANPAIGFRGDTTFYPEDFDGSAFLANDIVVTYTYVDGNGCSNLFRDTTVVTSDTSTTTGLDKDYCETHPQDTAFAAPPVGASVLGWNFSSTVPFIHVEPDNSFVVIDIAALAASGDTDFDISFDYQLGAGTATAPDFRFSVHENPAIVPIATFPENLCEDADSIHIFDYRVAPSASQVWTFTGSTGINGDYFDPTDATRGAVASMVYQVDETFNAVTCTTQETIEIRVDSLPTPSITGLDPLYCNNVQVATIYGAPAGASNSFDLFTAIQNTPIDTVKLFDPGLITTDIDTSITYHVTDTNGCTGIVTAPVSIRVAPDVLSITRDGTVPIIENSGFRICDLDSVELNAAVSAGSILLQAEYQSTALGVVDADLADRDAVINTANDNVGGPYLTDFVFEDINNCTDTFSFSYFVDSLHSVEWNTIDYRDTYCDNEGTVELEFNSTAVGQGFFIREGFNDTIEAGVDGKIRFDLSGSGVSDVNGIKLAHTSSGTQCLVEFIDTIFVNEAPIVSSITADSRCIADSITFTVNYSSTDPILNYYWHMDDDSVTVDSAYVESPKWLYRDARFRNISVQLVTNEGCSNNVYTQLNMPFETNPVADFSWSNECENDSTQFFNQSVSSSSFATSTWNFDDGSGDRILSGRSDIQHKFPAPQKYAVTLTVATVDNCIGTTTYDVQVRPFVDFDTESFILTDFENGQNDGWVPDDTSKSWEWGQPAGISIVTAASGDSAIVTKLGDNYIDGDISFVTGPCFDFTNLSKPMITLKYQSVFTDTKDGVVLQYFYTDTITGDTSGWINLGTIQDGVTDGINWYNSSTIDALNSITQPRGWTKTSLDETGAPGWVEARHELDFVKQIPNAGNIRFRFVFASDQTSSNDGFAFDDIWVGERKRIVLAEYFTNNSIACTVCPTVDDEVDAVISANDDPRDVIKLEYHRDMDDVIETTDPIHELKSDFIFARLAEYPYMGGVPYVVMDGGTNDGEYTEDEKYEGDASEWANDSLKLSLRTLIDPQFDIDVWFNLFGDQLKVNTEITANDSLSGDKLNMFIAVVEKTVDIVADPTSNGDLQFRNVVRDMMPSGAGVGIDRDWVPGQDSAISVSKNLEVDINYDSMAVVVFIQNKVTNEIYQAAYTDVPGLVTSVGTDLSPGSMRDFFIYPNPTTGVTHITFEGNVSEETEVYVYNSIGEIVWNDTVNGGRDTMAFNTTDLASGVYFVRVVSGKKVTSVKKLVVQK